MVAELIKRGKCETEILSKLISMKKLDVGHLITLYDNNIISVEQMKKLNLVLLENISIQRLIDLYKRNIKESSTDKEKQDYARYLDLCKLAMNNKENDDSEKAEFSNACMEKFIENFDENKKDEYFKGIEEFYKAGLINLETIIEWNSDGILITLFENKIIELSDVIEIIHKVQISFDTINRIVTEMVKAEDITYDERMKYIKTGFVFQEDIFELYNNNLIFENDMEQLAKMAIINSEDFHELLREKTREQAEEQSAIVLKGLNCLTKRNNIIHYNRGYQMGGHQNSKYIIDPYEREIFIELFGAIKVETDVEKDNPFYNYDFYVIPNEKGEIDLDSIVIAERYYEDKQTEKKFAQNNATYIFKYKDLMVLSRQTKSEMTKARKNIVFTANHTLATEKKDGRWASSTIQGIIKAIMSSNLDEYSKENQMRIIKTKMKWVYSEDEIERILNKASEIDSGKHTCEIIGPNVIRKQANKDFHNFDDDDER